MNGPACASHQRRFHKTDLRQPLESARPLSGCVARLKRPDCIRSRGSHIVAAIFMIGKPSRLSTRQSAPLTGLADKISGLVPLLSKALYRCSRQNTFSSLCNPSLSTTDVWAQKSLWRYPGQGLIDSKTRNYRSTASSLRVCRVLGLP